jgi:hypothetical protein
MLILKNNLLTSTIKLINADTNIKLTSDIDCEISALVTLSDGSTKCFNFIKENSYYKARFVFTEEDINYLNKVTLSLVLTSSTVEHTNTVDLDIDINKVKQTIKLSKSKDIKDIKEQLNKLTALVKDTLNNKVVYKTNLNIKQEDIKEGMIPVAINNEGLCMFKYPFIDHITEINGQKTVNNAILLTAKYIPIEQTDVATAIKAHTDAIKELNKLMQTISSELKTTNNKVADIEKALLLHTDSSII